MAVPRELLGTGGQVVVTSPVAPGDVMMLDVGGVGAGASSGGWVERRARWRRGRWCLRWRWCGRWWWRWGHDDQPERECDGGGGGGSGNAGGNGGWRQERERGLDGQSVVACPAGLVSADHVRGGTGGAAQVATRPRAAPARRRRWRGWIPLLTPTARQRWWWWRRAGLRWWWRRRWSVTPRAIAPAAAAAAAVPGSRRHPRRVLALGHSAKTPRGMARRRSRWSWVVSAPLVDPEGREGQAPVGTTFNVHVVCSHVAITGVDVQALQTTVDRTLVFDALGHPFSGGNPDSHSAFTGTFYVTETASGGATTVSSVCRDNDSTDPLFCQAFDQDVVFGRSRIESAGVDRHPRIRHRR